jgi:hypothetical protein
VDFGKAFDSSNIAVLFSIVATLRAYAFTVFPVNFLLSSYVSLGKHTLIDSYPLIVEGFPGLLGLSQKV